MPKTATLQAWLEKIQQIHPVKWDLGLDRVQAVAERLDILTPAKQVILIAGTNGKGSCCEALARLCGAKQLSWGKTCSPFIGSYNEQIEINGALASDTDIVIAFEAIEVARGDITLTYFEFSALAAFYLFKRAALDVAIVEVGLGGRLDAMNILSPDVSVITQIGLDHQDYLGDTRELIAVEKAGILRHQKPAVFVDPEPPASLVDAARSLAAPTYQLAKQLTLEAIGAEHWRLSYQADVCQFPKNGLHEHSCSAAIAALWALGHTLSQSQIDAALNGASLVGRFQRIEYNNTQVILDVAHNPNAAQRLVTLLDEAGIDEVHAVVAMYSDKDFTSVFSTLCHKVSHWHICDMNLARSATVDQLQTALRSVLQTSVAADEQSVSSESMIHVYASAHLAYDGAVAAGQLPVLVFGSFPIVAATLERLEILGVYQTSFNRDS